MWRSLTILLTQLLTDTEHIALQFILNSTQGFWELK
jgi:hypothetical protein